MSNLDALFAVLEAVERRERAVLLAAGVDGADLDALAAELNATAESEPTTEEVETFARIYNAALFEEATGVGDPVDTEARSDAETAREELLAPGEDEAHLDAIGAPTTANAENAPALATSDIVKAILGVLALQTSRDIRTRETLRRVLTFIEEVSHLEIDAKTDTNNAEPALITTADVEAIHVEALELTEKLVERNRLDDAYHAAVMEANVAMLSLDEHLSSLVRFLCARLGDKAPPALAYLLPESEASGIRVRSYQSGKTEAAHERDRTEPTVTPRRTRP